jgi:hypothetical protein
LYDDAHIIAGLQWDAAVSGAAMTAAGFAGLPTKFRGSKTPPGAGTDLPAERLLTGPGLRA